MENQDIYNIYKLYREGYYKDELGDFKDPEREREFRTPSGDSEASFHARSEEPYERQEYSVEEHREDGGRRVYSLYKDSKFVDDYYARSSENKADAIRVLARRNNISPSEIEGYYGEENAEDAEDYGNTFPGAPDVKIPWEQTSNQKKWSELHHRLRALANSNRPSRREEELEIIAQLQHIVDTDPKFKNEYVSKPMFS